MTEWNDGRLDDLSKRVDRIETKMDKGFARLDKKMDDGFARIDGKFDAVNERLDGLQRSLTQIAWTFGIGMLTLACALIGVLATKA